MMPFLLFQSTHPRGVRHETTEGYPYKQIFQSTHPRGVRRIRASSVGDILCISIHAPTWGATYVYYKGILYPHVFQSTHPRGVRRNLPYQCQDKRGISIHAPTWGATFLTRAVLTSLTNFNPRTHVGCDLRQRNWERDYFTFQSTHPRGVRPISLPKCFPPKIFQSTHPRGVRHFLTLSLFYFLLFQSTHPRGVRPKLLHKLYSLLNFNPRTHVGCDLHIITSDFVLEISIHAPTWGATSTS